ncbi:UvrB/UvrC motif-containing protein [Anaeromassilibacillus sp. An200]|uniref:UvrB/UvrC motif-containing protein n=1 Tax=Candidatus Caccousia stercoris TaxID=2840723 RepID=A0A9D1FU54_9FIRM|nr:UvrB/UvrC motif-containing protein [Anaeromassilibacillus sp. An200]OUP09009.1 hypothetical protein B5F35_12990 [Anaeromassilibacillus sp. An200]HIS79829.1 UvrB/UvrC motif-containing protein [Candidatus Caccousia stercoris]
MMCQACGKHPAITHVKTITNGELAEFSICAECARRLGYGNLFAELGRGLGILGFQPESEERCRCGASWEDIVRSGRVGCPECYHTFYDRLVPVVQRIHGSAHHRGKAPGGNLPRAEEPAEKGLLLVKRRQLKEAIDAEKFEDAAVLRDEIRALEAGGHE